MRLQRHTYVHVYNDIIHVSNTTTYASTLCDNVLCECVGGCTSVLGVWACPLLQIYWSAWLGFACVWVGGCLVKRCSTLVEHYGMPNEVWIRDCEMISNHDWEMIAATGHIVYQLVCCILMNPLVCSKHVNVWKWVFAAHGGNCTLLPSRGYLIAVVRWHSCHRMAQCNAMQHCSLPQQSLAGLAVLIVWLCSYVINKEGLGLCLTSKWNLSCNQRWLHHVHWIYGLAYTLCSNAEILLRCTNFDVSAL